MRGDSNCEPYFTLPQSAAAVGGGRGSVCSSSRCFFVVYRHMSRFFGFLAPPRRLEIRVLVLAICHATGRPRRGNLGGGQRGGSPTGALTLMLRETGLVLISGLSGSREPQSRPRPLRLLALHRPSPPSLSPLLAVPLRCFFIF